MAVVKLVEDLFGSMPINYTIPDFDITKDFTDLQNFQYLDKYSKFLWECGRRETWEETVTRTVNFLRELSKNKLPERIYQEIFKLIYMGEVSPSMRLFATAGEYARKNNIAIYNCSFLPIDCIEAIAEILWLSISGCGVGYSVESHNINKLPIVKPQISTIHQYVIEDTGEDWFYSTLFLLKSLFNGEDVKFDYSQLRPAGTPLKTKGGYASGGEILKAIHDNIREWILNAQERNLTSLEVHDICTRLADAGISGGVRRAAMISFFDENDSLMLSAKSGNFYETHPWRANANNSVILLKDKYTKHELDTILHELWENGSGEPGIVFPKNLINRSPKWREFEYGVEQIRGNPCFEIGLEGIPVEINGGGGEFCNLSAIICKPEDTLESLKHKTRIATLIGDIQSLATNFPILRPEWKRKCEKDRLLGVNHIGHAVCQELRNPNTQRELRKVAEKTDVWFSNFFNVPRSAAILSVKPSGNSSVLYNTGPGINPIHEPFSLRNVVVNRFTSMYNFLYMNSIPYLEIPNNPEKVVFSFPYKAPDNAILLNKTSAIEQCEYWKQVTINMMHHNASCSIVYKPDEITDLKQWIYDNQDIIGGQAFFPYFEANYPYLPIYAIDETTYNNFVSNFPTINWKSFYLYESGIDEKTIVMECTSERCDIGN